VSPSEIKPIIEAALMVAGEPLDLDRLAALVGEEEDPREAVGQALAALEEDYAGRGIELREVAQGYRFQARAELAPWLNRLWEEKPPRYSRALVETLAIIAYRQPVTRGDIEDLRGVALGTGMLKTLLEREWIRVVGHREVPGRPAVYATTPKFLDYFNLKTLSELPPLPEPRPVDPLPPAEPAAAQEELPLGAVAEG
jgi:segregation and condensation protein B